MVQRYESLMLAVPEITQDEIKQIENELDKVVLASKGSTISFERWGKFKLAFPVEKNEYGVYFLARFEVPQGTKVVTDLQDLYHVKLEGFVMRHVITRLDLDASLEYQRPKSLEETPSSRDMNTFLKDNQMEGLFGSDQKDGRRPAFKRGASKQSDNDDIGFESNDEDQD